MGLRTASIAILVLAATLATPGVALAGGFEYPGGGARSLGRGGAYYARVDDPLAIQYNPAQLAALPDPQVSVDLNYPFYDYCFKRYWTEGTGPSAVDHVGPEVCNDATPLPNPNLGFATRLANGLGIGIGVFTPTAVSSLEFPNESATVYDPETGDYAAAPSRYSLISRDLLLIFPEVGIAYAPTAWLRIGASFGWGVAKLNFATTATANGSNDPGQDIVTSLDATDSFVPRVNASVQVEPTPGLEAVVAFTWTDSVQASGDLNLELGQGVRDLLETFGAMNLPDQVVVKDATVNSPQPWQLAFGVRYGQKRPSPPRPSDDWKFGHRVDDKMATEVWDVELNVIYEHNSSVDAIRVHSPPDQHIYQQPGGIDVPVPEEIALPHQWKDQVSVRLGGDYNVVPDVLALRTGLSFETKGVPDTYNQLDFRPVQRFGLHAGLTVRVDRTDISIAYAHFFEQDVTNARGEGEIVQTVGQAYVNGMPLMLGSPKVVNDGEFRSHINAVALGLDYHF